MKAVPTQVVQHIVMPMLDNSALCQFGQVNQEMHHLECSTFTWRNRVQQEYPNRLTADERQVRLIEATEDEAERAEKWKALYGRYHLLSLPPRINNGQAVEVDGWFYAGARKTVWRQFLQWSLDVPCIALFCVEVASVVRTYPVIRDVVALDNAIERRGVVLLHFIMLVLDVVCWSLFAVGAVLAFYRLPYTFDKLRRVFRNHGHPFAPIELNADFGGRLETYGYIGFHFFCSLFDLLPNLAFIVCWCAGIYRGVAIVKEMDHRQLRYSRGDHCCVSLKHFANLIVDVPFIAMLVVVAVGNPLRLFKLVSRIRHIPASEQGSCAVRCEIAMALVMLPVDWLALLGLVVLASCDFWRLPTFVSAMRRGHGVYRSVLRALWLALKDVACLVFVIPVIFIGLRRIGPFLARAWSIARRFYQESDEANVVARHQVEVKAPPSAEEVECEKLYQTALEDLRTEDGFGLPGDYDYAFRASDRARHRCYLECHPQPQPNNNDEPLDSTWYFRQPQLRWTDFPGSMSLWRSLMLAEAWDSITGFHHVILFPFRVLAWITFPIYAYVKWRRSDLDKEQPHVPKADAAADPDILQSSVVDRDAVEEQQPGWIAPGSFSMSFLFDAVSWLYKRCPTPSFDLTQFVRMERFLVVNLLCFVPLLLNEMAVGMFALHGLLINLTTFTLMPKSSQPYTYKSLPCCAHVLAYTSVVLQGVLLPLFLLADIVLLLLPLLAVSFATNSSHLLWPLQHLFTAYTISWVWVLEVAVAVVLAATLQLLVRYCRLVNHVYRPWALYGLILLSIWKSIRGQGFYKELLAIVTRRCFKLTRSGGAFRVLGELLLLVFAIAWCCWPLVLNLSLSLTLHAQYWWLFLTAPVSLWLMYRAWKIIDKNWTSSVNVQGQAGAGENV